MLFRQQTFWTTTSDVPRTYRSKWSTVFHHLRYTYIKPALNWLWEQSFRALNGPKRSTRSILLPHYAEFPVLDFSLKNTQKTFPEAEALRCCSTGDAYRVGGFLECFKLLFTAYMCALKLCMLTGAGWRCLVFTRCKFLIWEQCNGYVHTTKVRVDTARNHKSIRTKSDLG